MRGPHLETSHTRRAKALVSSAIASNAPSLAGVDSAASSLPLRKEVSAFPKASAAPMISRHCYRRLTAQRYLEAGESRRGGGDAEEPSPCSRHRPTPALGSSFAAVPAAPPTRSPTEPSGPCARSRDSRFQPPVKNPMNIGFSSLCAPGQKNLELRSALWRDESRGILAAFANIMRLATRPSIDSKEGGSEGTAQPAAR